MIYLIVLVSEIYYNRTAKVFNLKRTKKSGAFSSLYKDIPILKMFWFRNRKLEEMEHGRFELNQGARIHSVKSDDRYRSFDSHTSKASSLQQDDDRFPSYVQLYKSMIVKCVECNHLLPRMRDIFDDQGTNLSYHSCKSGLFKL